MENLLTEYISFKKHTVPFFTEIWNPFTAILQPLLNHLSKHTNTNIYIPVRHTLSHIITHHLCFLKNKKIKTLKKTSICHTWACEGCVCGCVRSKALTSKLKKMAILLNIIKLSKLKGRNGNEKLAQTASKQKLNN